MDYYTSIAQGYDELHEQEQLAKLKILLHHVPLHGNVLDIGAGTCIVARHLGKNVTVVSVDPSKKMLDFGVGERHVAMAEHLPFPDVSFDCIISLTALHHCDLEQALSEIKRVAKPPALVAISFLKRSPQFQRFEQLFQNLFHQCERIDAYQDILFLSQPSIKQTK